MDTTTVLEIIKMIENKLDVIQEQEEIYKDASIYLNGKYTGLNDLRVHLQSFIEGELNKTEQ